MALLKDDVILALQQAWLFFFRMLVQALETERLPNKDEDEKSNRQDLSLGRRTTEINCPRCVSQQRLGPEATIHCNDCFHGLGKSREVDVTAPSSTSRGPRRVEQYVRQSGKVPTRLALGAPSLSRNKRVQCGIVRNRAVRDLDGQKRTKL